MKMKRLSVWIILLTTLTVFSQSLAGESYTKPRLIVQITIDQMRGDYPMRYRDRLGDGGFRYLMDSGTHYINAHYKHADTETPVGHAALFTGTWPSNNGIVAGSWYDPDMKRIVYNCEDDRYPMIGKPAETGKGRAPTRLLSSTIGDELALSNNGRSRIFSVSIKDRGAILPGGHIGKAFWYSKSDGSFVSSTYYYKEYPQWVKEWNAKNRLTNTKTSRGSYCMMRQLTSSLKMMLVPLK